MSIQHHFPGVEAAGEFLATATLYELIKDDGPRISIIALLLVFVASLFQMRRLGRTLFAVLCLAIGMIWAGTGMALMGLKLSLINFAGIPILMGIGIDVIIHLLHRIGEEGPGRVAFSLRTTGWAALLSVCTTMFSFGALLIAHNRGIHSLGEMVVSGLGLMTLAAFLLVPLGWMSVWAWRANRERKAAG